MRTIGFDPQVPATSPVWSDDDTSPRTFAEVVSEADVVSLHVPLTPATRNLMDAARIATMKHDAILINTARGGVVDEAAVAAALRARRLGGAALDVFEHEPLARGVTARRLPASDIDAAHRRGDARVERARIVADRPESRRSAAGTRLMLSCRR